MTDTPDLSKEAVERLAILFDDGADTSCYRSNREYREVAATLRALSARIAELEAEAATVREKALREAVNIINESGADGWAEHARASFVILHTEAITALIPKEPPHDT